jgi:hypothetical protein
MKPGGNPRLADGHFVYPRDLFRGFNDPPGVLQAFSVATAFDPILNQADSCLRH